MISRLMASMTTLPLIFSALFLRNWKRKASLPVAPQWALGRAIPPDMESNMTTKDKAPRDTLTSVVWQHDGTAVVQVKGHPALVFNPMKASLLNRNYAQQFGWDNRIKNKTSVTADKTTGRVDTAVKYQLAKALIEFYEQGGDEWEMRAAGGAREGTDAGLVLQALMNVKGWTLDECNAKVGKMAENKGVERKDVLASLAKNADIIREVADIKAKRAAASNVDAASMLDELDALDEEGQDEDAGTPADDTPPF